MNVAEAGTLSAEIIVRLLVAKLKQQHAQEARATLDLCITHDITLHLLKDRVLGLRYEEYGEIEFLDGVVVFERRPRAPFATT